MKRFPSIIARKQYPCYCLEIKVFLTDRSQAPVTYNFISSCNGSLF